MSIRDLPISCLLILTACSAGQLHVISQPSVVSVIVHADGQAARKVGETPVNLDSSGFANTQGLLQISLEKEGFQTQTIVLPRSALNGKGELSVNLKPEQAPVTNNQDDGLQKIASGVAEAQSDIKNKNYDDAEKKLQFLLNQFPHVSVLYDLLGNVHYFRHNLDQALVSYRKSQAISASEQTSQVIKKIEDLRASRMPAEAGK